jgi:hypothetical protein
LRAVTQEQLHGGNIARVYGDSERFPIRLYTVFQKQSHAQGEFTPDCRTKYATSEAGECRFILRVIVYIMSLPANPFSMRFNRALQSTQRDWFTCAGHEVINRVISDESLL